MKIKAIWLTILWILSTTNLHRAAALQAGLVALWAGDR